MKKLLIALMLVLFIPSIIFAASLEGRITRNGTSVPATQALVVFTLDGVEKARTITGDDGLYFIRNIPQGTYQVRISYRDLNKEYSGVVVGQNPQTYNFGI
jgi:hypothetical protein